MKNLRYADDTTLMAESKEELKSCLMMVKEKSEKAGLKLKIQKNKIMASSPIISWQIEGGKVETVTDFFSLGSETTGDRDCSHEIKGHLILGRKAMTKLNSALKSRDITLPTMVHIVKVMFFPVFMYRCESWTIKKPMCVYTQPCPTLCNSMDQSPSDSPVHGIFQARILEWVAISFSRGSFQPSRELQTCVFCVSRWILYHWAKNWCFRIVVLEKTLEHPLDCREIKPVSPKGNQPWIFTGRIDAKAEAPILWPPHSKSWLTGKDPNAGKDWGQEGKRATENEVVGWHHRLNRHEFEQTQGDSEGQENLACCSPWGSQRVGQDVETEQQQFLYRIHSWNRGFC